MPLAVQVIEPVETTSHVVFASPHSGRLYPSDLLARAQVDARTLRSSEDAFVDLLVADAPAFGAPLVTTEVPRAYVDFNRGEDEFDHALIEGVARGALNPRVASGLGVIARVVANGRPIYRGRLTRAEAEARIARYWRPYHQALDALLQRQRARFGQVVLCDMHSMPHEAICAHAGRPEVVLGDRYGAACAPGVLDQIEAVFRNAGLKVMRNAPFAGAYVAQHYGRPSMGMHAIQIELDRALYLDEMRIEPGAGFAAFQTLMRGIVADIAALGHAPAQRGLAAE
ncbi:N-formylglutamate amidohydrolase [Pararhodobacter sp. SW119]|uniref:N-formylglutamate amidohydrolase n=1 Tax=Pararhodobacter sp. SW119 TaxID=2780075 RepID=UPI001ADF3F54|nr:N-formylglutamate amidohydrolase [Pararhodobacter sp. SW119]